jgi:hypothetical protein
MPRLCLIDALQRPGLLSNIVRQAFGDALATERSVGNCVKRVEASMQILIRGDRSLLQAILAIIGRSPIAVARPAVELPDGFTEVDVAVLDWIAAEGRRIGRGYTRL